jgi:hypothetical protein
MTRDWIAEGRVVAALTGVWFGIGAVAPASAYIRVDEFTDTQSVSLTGAEVSAGDAALAPEVLGGERDLLLERIAGTGDANVAIDPGGTGLLFLENAVGSQSALSLVYDGIDDDPATVDPSGLGNIDLTELGTEDTFGLLMRSDQTADVTIQIYDATDPSGQTWSSGGFQASPGGYRWFELPIAELDQQGPNGAADPTDIGAIVVRVSGPLGLDAQIDSIRVPEPGAWTLGGAVLVALASLRRVSR